jgi:predicted nucleic acid-binding protein
MTYVFADTYYFLAFWNPADAGHDRAVSVSQTLRAPLLTTGWVLTELADAMSAPRQRMQFLSFYDQAARNPRIRIVLPTPQLFRRAMDLYAARPDKAWSLTDCASFVTMRQHHITDALTADHHFEQAGYVALFK